LLRVARAVLVLHPAAPAVPVLPPDPLEVVQLEHEQGDDPEEDLRTRHRRSRIVAPRPGRNGPIDSSVRRRGPSRVAYPPAHETDRPAARPCGARRRRRDAGARDVRAEAGAAAEDGSRSLAGAEESDGAGAEGRAEAGARRDADPPRALAPRR